MAFSSQSPWNTPIADAPVAKESAGFTTWLRTYCPMGLRLNGGADWGMPVYRSSAKDPLVNVNGIRFRLPKDVTPMAGSDGAISIIDNTTNQDVQLWRFNPATLKCQGAARYWLDSEGLDEKIGGTKGNYGHRGCPGFVHCVHYDEVAIGAITHRLKVAIPGTKGAHVFPMSGHEQRDGVIPEGATLRLKPGLVEQFTGQARILAQAFATYGLLVGDNNGSPSMTLKLEVSPTTDWLLPASKFAGLTWGSFEFIQLGWRG